MTDEKALVPIDEKKVEFYGDELTAVLVNIQSESQIYVPVKPISDALGLDWSAQYRRIQRDQVLSEVSHLIAITAIKPERGRPDSLCLPLKFVPGWLFGIQAGRVKEELRDKVLRYQRECYDVLAEAFIEGRLTADPSFNELLETNTPAVQAYKVLQQLTRLARSQILLEARVGAHELMIGTLDKRLELVEDILGGADRHVTPDQASQISQAVKTVAMKLSKASGRNEYGGVYGELYRKFGITSYKQLPVAKFDEAISWMNEWRESVEGDSPF